MKTYKFYKELVIAYWEALDDKNLTDYEKKKDAAALSNFFNFCLKTGYAIFGAFSLVSTYFFVTRVIF